MIMMIRTQSRLVAPGLSRRVGPHISRRVGPRLSQRLRTSEHTGFTPADVPQAEADALFAFGQACGWEGWTSGAYGSGDADAWGKSRTVGDWYGVTVSVDGHVSVIALPGIGLDGNASNTLDPLAGHCTTLDLGQNPDLDDIALSAQTALNDIDLAGCDFGASVVAVILAGLDTAGVSGGTLDIGGSNSSPNSAGVTSLLSLKNRSWSMVYNTILMENSGSFYAIMATGDATIRSSATDVSGQTGKLVLAYDGTNDKFAVAYGHGEDDAAAFGSNLIVNGAFDDSSNWSFTNPPWTISGGAANYDATTASNITYTAGLTLPVGAYVRLDFDLASAASAKLGVSGVYTFLPSYTDVFPGSNSYSGNVLIANTFFLRGSAASPAIWSIDNIVLRQYTALGTDALQLRNQLESSGSSRNWASIESGFDPSKISKIEVFPSE